MPVYLDHAATTPLRPEALAAMLPYLSEGYGNPFGVHSVSRRAKAAIESARDVMATALGADPGDVVFTSGGTESINTAIAGALSATGGSAVLSAVEHAAAFGACPPSRMRVVPVDHEGRVDLEALADLLGDDVAVVSVMLANNEIGTVQPLGEVAQLVRRKAPRALLHTDAVHAFSWLDVADMASGADLVSVSAHKFGGPKGVGALVVRSRARVEPLLRGGPQERGRRAGTHNVAGIAGMAAAAEVTIGTRARRVEEVGRLRDELADGLLATVEGARETVSRRAKVAGSCHMTFPGVESEALLVLLDDAGVCASAGSACASGAIEPSHVLRAVGMDDEEASTAVRFSFGWSSSADDVEAALAVVPKAVAELRA